MQTTPIPLFHRLLPAAFMLLAACATTSPSALPTGDAAATPVIVPPPAAPVSPTLSYFEQQREALTTQLAAAVREGALEIDTPRDNDLEITLPADPNFIEGSAQLRPEAQALLAQLAAILHRFDHTTLTIIGYSDNAGSPTQALQLSATRAQQVAQSLAAQGIAATRMQVAGRGMEYPRASNRTEFGRALNRRIQVTILPIRRD